jgi:hypothetical protein
MAKELKIQIEDKGGLLRFKTLFYGVLIVIGLTLAVVIAFNLGRDDGLTTYRKEFKTYQNTVVVPTLALSDSLKKKVNSLLVIADSTKTVAESLTVKINGMQRNNTLLRVQNAKLSDSLKSIPLPPECDAYKDLVVSLETEVDSLHATVNTLEKRDTLRLVEINNLRIGLSFQTTRSDSLQKVVINFPKPPKPRKLLGIELSNRTMFVAGIVVGATAVGVVK